MARWLVARGALFVLCWVASSIATPVLVSLVGIRDEATVSGVALVLCLCFFALGVRRWPIPPTAG
jgi:hypothetical protein